MGEDPRRKMDRKFQAIEDAHNRRSHAEFSMTPGMFAALSILSTLIGMWLAS